MSDTTEQALAEVAGRVLGILSDTNLSSGRALDKLLELRSELGRVHDWTLIALDPVSAKHRAQLMGLNDFISPPPSEWRNVVARLTKIEPQQHIVWCYDVPEDWRGGGLATGYPVAVTPMGRLILGAYAARLPA